MDTNDTPLCTEDKIAQGFRNSDGKRIVDHRDSESERFHALFDAEVRDMMESVRTALLESTESCSKMEIVGQLLMETIAGGGDTRNDPESYFDGKFNLHQKYNLMALAEHMGPDWAQALYHAAVFITKVA